MMIKGIWLKGFEDIDHALAIRTKVFIHEQGVDPEIEMDELDQQAEHLVVYDDDQPVATGRLIKDKENYLMGRIAVLKEFRGQKLGDFVVRVMLRRAFDEGAKEIHIHAQLQVQGFYEKLGFKAYGDVYQEAGIDHINMVCKEECSGGCCCH